jgi:hypothetical protein
MYIKVEFNNKILGLVKKKVIFNKRCIINKKELFFDYKIIWFNLRLITD